MNNKTIISNLIWRFSERIGAQLVAFIVSILAIKFLVGYIKKHDFKVFGWYRIILGIILLGYYFFLR